MTVGQLTGTGKSPESFPWFAAALAAGLILMLGANGIMVWQSAQGHRDLVRSDYYQAGLRQDGAIRRNAMAEKPGSRISFAKEGGEWLAIAADANLRGAECSI